MVRFRVGREEPAPELCTKPLREGKLGGLAAPAAPRDSPGERGAAESIRRLWAGGGREKGERGHERAHY